MRPVFAIILGVFLAAIGVIMFVHDADFIFTGNTADLNQILEENSEIPRDKYVTYTCSYCLGNYGETQSYWGFIPLPGKSQQFAFIGENGMIISVKAGKKSLVEDLRVLSESDYDEDYTPVTFTGCVQTNHPDLDRYLESYLSGVDFENSDLQLTYLEIDTTKTRPKLVFMYTAIILIGAGCIIFAVRKIRS